MTPQIELRGVSKRYGRAYALTDVTFTCPEGTITAFCGPNGAGKSTALRVLTGIIRPDSGAALISGQRIQDLPDPARSIGSLLDASAFHPGRSVRETLRLAAFTIGEPGRRADECAAIVGLESVGTRRVGKLSLGMRQRLGIAHALIGRPRVLVLDEPSNGLDPSGMRWLDELLRSFADQGGTVVVSTHHLAAAERTADRVVAISRGRVVEEARLTDLRGVRTVVRAVGEEQLAVALTRAGAAVTRSATGLIVDLDPGAVGQIAHEEGVALVELRTQQTRLDAYLATVTENEFEGRLV